MTDIQTEFIREAIWHGSLAEADSMLGEYPELSGTSIFTAAILGHAELVSAFLAADPAQATSTAAPYGGNALVYLCMSKYLRLHPDRTEAFLKTARILLEAGADPNAGFWTTGAYPEFETALYGAAGVAHHEGLTRLLLEFGADPNDGEAVYHSPETDDNRAMKALVETGQLTPENLVLMLIRKHDWHDYPGAKYLLEAGADPNRIWGTTSPLHHALARINDIAFINLLLDHGADPGVACEGMTAAARAAREGRADVLQMLRKRGISYVLEGADRLIEACAFGDAERVEAIARTDQAIAGKVIFMGGMLLSKFSAGGNAAGVKQLLSLGVEVNEPFTTGDGYWGIPKNSLAIHVAAWLGHPDVVQLLIEAGASVDAADANGRTPLQLAVRACVDSYWMDRRTPRSVALLLKAGANASDIPLPTGYPEVDKLLAAS
nr:ankyrin repeat domain-containing protein [uncultured Dyadobacter sp.]